ncbi:hypothetical protein VNO80_20605 [Phaseolus coccineus]|uniref:Uncharacterized protein n=1 Tax=Phaseolus coccineus TaxID=3886 RepID=A0AAN9M279_PHACN
MCAVCTLQSFCCFVLNGRPLSFSFSVSLFSRFHSQHTLSLFLCNNLSSSFSQSPFPQFVNLESDVSASVGY